jgi:hypothetical protein
MDPIDRSLLAKILGRLGSDCDGEVLAAARKLVAMLDRSGQTWDEVVGGSRPGPASGPSPDRRQIARDLLLIQRHRQRLPAPLQTDFVAVAARFNNMESAPGDDRVASILRRVVEASATQERTGFGRRA